MHELRAHFRIARFMNKTADYAKLHERKSCWHPPAEPGASRLLWRLPAFPLGGFGLDAARARRPNSLKAASSFADSVQTSKDARDPFIARISCAFSRLLVF
jgi:hypothetical protein